MLKFHDSINAGDIALVYFSGHGCEYQNDNYLITSELPTEERLLPHTALNARELLDGVEAKEPHLTVLLLDCCRVFKGMARSTRQTDNGLAAMTAGTQSIIGFSTSPNTVAYDNDGKGSRNSPYTAQLLKHLPTPRVDIDSVLRRVGKGVREICPKQEPYVHHKLTEEDNFLVV